MNINEVKSLPSKGLQSNEMIYKQVGFPGVLSGKESTCQCRRCKRHRFDPWIEKIPSSRRCNPLQDSCRESSMEDDPGKLQSMGW